ncbi:prenylated Rab acceptor protein 1 [Anabrus simplex]|uniref:prenylated Rab acceptor protein 1 n=1 Tax=Anabrus simplex TaxID=316456 RepID=UPI0034DD04D5
MADVEIEVTGNITTNHEKVPTKSMFQLPMHISLSSPAAREWFGQRRENVRPWSVFLSTANIRAPSSLPRLSKRVMKNIEYFQSNYLFVFLGLIAYCLITSPILLIAVAGSLGACYILSLKNAERKLTILGHELTLAQQYGLVALCSLPIFHWAGAGAALFWVLGASFFIITLHAALYNIDAILTPEEERFDLVMEEV